MENDMDAALALLSRWVAVDITRVLDGHGHMEPLYEQTRELLSAHDIVVEWDAKANAIVRRGVLAKGAATE